MYISEPLSHAYHQHPYLVGFYERTEENRARSKSTRVLLSAYFAPSPFSSAFFAVSEIFTYLAPAAFSTAAKIACASRCPDL